jgi:hypothetical protein
MSVDEGLAPGFAWCVSSEQQSMLEAEDVKFDDHKPVGNGDSFGY